jgi:hypothetical protein
MILVDPWLKTEQRVSNESTGVPSMSKITLRFRGRHHHSVQPFALLQKKGGIHLVGSTEVFLFSYGEK